MSCHCQVTTLELSRGPKCDDKYKFIKTDSEGAHKQTLDRVSQFFHTGADSNRCRVSKLHWAHVENLYRNAKKSPGLCPCG